MTPSLYISIFGLGLSVINDLKQAICSQFSSSIDIYWTNIADKNLQVLLIHDDFSDLPIITNDDSRPLRILKLRQNEQQAGEIINDVLYLPLRTTQALAHWLKQSFPDDFTQTTENKIETVASAVVQQQKLSHQSISKAFNCIFHDYANLSKFLIQNQEHSLSFFDVQSKELYSNHHLKMSEMPELEVIPADLNSILLFKKQFKPRDLSHGIWQFVYDHVDEAPEYTQSYQLQMWPQPPQSQQRHELFKISAYFGQGCSIQYVQSKMNIDRAQLNRFLFACDIAQILREIPSEQAHTVKTEPIDPTPAQTGAFRGFFNQLRKKLGI
nr:hypothetical protein [Providencia huaxiensis]